MKYLITVLVIMVFAVTASYSKITTYDEYFKSMDASNYDQIVESFISDDLDMVYGGIKRIGELKLTNARQEIFGLMAQSNPIANQGKKRINQLKDIFLISVWTMGQIGNNQDAIEIASYLKDITDKEGQKALIQALGEIHPSPEGLTALNNLTTQITDETIAETLFIAILKHNSKSSASYLITMSKRHMFSPDFNQRLASAANLLLKSGK